MSTSGVEDESGVVIKVEIKPGTAEADQLSTNTNTAVADVVKVETETSGTAAADQGSTFNKVEIKTGTAEADQLSTNTNTAAADVVKVETETGGAAAADQESTIVMASSKSFEPPAFVSEMKSYEEYKKDLYMWSRITSIPKKNQAEVVVYNMEGHRSRIKEKIVLNIGDKIESAEDGIDQLVKFLDTIYKKDEMADAWAKYKIFQKISRTDDIPINDFIAEFEKEYILAKSAGCVYSDTLIAFRLLEATVLNDIDEKFVLTGVDYKEAKEQQNLYDQVKSSLKKFQGRNTVVGDERGIRYDPALVAGVAEALVAQGWRKPGGRRRSNTDPRDGGKRNSALYKGKKNPLGQDGKPLTCFKCQSVYHMRDKCPNNKNYNTDNVLDGTKNSRTDTKEYGMVATIDTSNKLNNIHNELMNLIFDGHEIVMVTNTEKQLCLMVEEAGVRGVIDSACSKTVAGIRYVNNYMIHLTESAQELIKDGEPSKTIYQFGGGEKRISVKRVGLPAIIGELAITIVTEVVDADIPLLIGANSLEVSKAVLDFGGMCAKFFSSVVPLMKVGSGHFCISLLPNSIEAHISSDINEEVVLHVVGAEDLTYKKLQKLHHLCGHPATDRLVKLLAKAGKLTKKNKQELIQIKESCDSCQKNCKNKPRPKFALPRVETFNQIVTIDLKEYDKNVPQRRYICYLIDMHTRFVVARFIPNKNPAQIVETIMEKWIGVGYGVMDGLHTDLGGEMSNKELDDVASKVGVTMTTTASYSPHQNGINERNHGTVDIMMKKMLDSDSSLTPEMALFWSMNAKNSLENCYGFSPYQLVFASNPQLPSATRCGPPGYESTTKSEVFAKNINALHRAREAFIKAESSAVLKKALKSRVHARGENVVVGDNIYYHKGNKKSWQGPDKVIAVNGKKLFIDKGAHIATVNRDNSVKKGEEFWTAGEVNSDNTTENSKEIPPLDEHDVLSPDDFQQYVEVREDEAIPNEIPDVEVPPLNVQQEVGTELHEGDRRDDFHFKDIKKGDILKFVPGDSDHEIEGQVLSRAGKLGGKYESWWNIRNRESGEENSFDSSKFKNVQMSSNSDGDGEVERVFVVQIPRYLHNVSKCIEAKEKELSSWDEFGVYKEVPDEGQATLGTNWMLVEKVINGELGVKARLCIRGDQEKSKFRTDSPTVHKTSINIFYMLAATKGWRIQTADIKCAFLQGENIDREVFVKPPKERRVRGVIWKMLKRAYGFTDASRGFYLELSKTLIELGCVQSKFDHAVYLYYGKEGALEGLALTHVDDLLHGSGSNEFYKNVMESLKEKFQFGVEEQDEFRYVGMYVKQLKDSIVVNQDDYIASMDLPSPMNGVDENVLDEDGQSEFRSLLGRIGWLGSHSRPDLVFDHISLSTKLGKATVEDYSYALKIAKKMLADSTEMKFSKLGEMSSWVIDAYADAGYRSLPDRVSSCGGQVVVIRDTLSETACVLSWRGRKLKRIVTSSTAAETLALNDVVSEVIFTKSLLGEIFGSGVSKIPVILYTDSKNVQRAVNSTCMVEDPRLRIDIACLRESLEKGEVNDLRRVSSKEMIANCLTKRGASSKTLLGLLRTGYLRDVANV